MNKIDQIKKKRNFIYFTQNMNYDLYRFDIF